MFSAVLASAEAAVAAAPGQGEAAWVTDPSTPGDDLPQVGRSLFDHLMIVQRNGVAVYDVPGSFAALRQRIEERVQRDATSSIPGLKQVLIPLGRSLQRLAAAPEFFASPRIVLAVDEGPAGHAQGSGMLLKDRLFLGYQPRSDVLEVISYNEAAGRFEFQIVKDFRAGGDPKVVYANRRLCASCHQNAAPIFSRPAWDETNANPKVAALLNVHGRDFQAVAVNRGVDLPNAIDGATQRANLLSTYQLLWRDGCGGASRGALECRAALFAAALQYRLSGLRQFDRHSNAYRHHLLGQLLANARTRWPAGLALPNPDIPNRDPLAGDAGERHFARQVDVAARFDPLAMRGALATWRVDDVAVAERTVAGLAGFIAESDIVRLDEHLAAQARRGSMAWRDYASPCRVTLRHALPRTEHMQFECGPAPAAASVAGRDALRLSGDVELSGGAAVSGRLQRLQLGEHGELREFELGAATPVMHGTERRLLLPLRSSQLRVRSADGSAIERIELRWSGAAGSVQVRAVDDFAPVTAAIQTMLLASQQGQFDGFDPLPFRRASLMPALFDRLGLPARRWCCLDAAGMAPARVEPVATTLFSGTAGQAVPLAPAATAFYPYCANCHAGADRAPPNFLFGDAAQVRRQLTQCAERLYVRLAMWQLAPGERVKTPMPPASALRGLHWAEPAWRGSAELARLSAWAGDTLNSETGRQPELDALLARGYESLRPCLPATAGVARTQ